MRKRVVTDGQTAEPREFHYYPLATKLHHDFYVSIPINWNSKQK